MNYQTAQGWLRSEEREFLFAMAKEATTILNIGVEYGASIVCLAEGNPNAQIAAIDVNLSSNLTAYPNVAYLEHDSTTLDYTNSTYDLIFIDGDHSYVGVYKDIEAVTPALAIGGMIIFHDCGDFADPTILEHRVCPGVNQAVSDLLGENSSYIELDRVGTMRIFIRQE